jgi:hypothetical protein
MKDELQWTGKAAQRMGGTIGENAQLKRAQTDTSDLDMGVDRHREKVARAQRQGMQNREGAPITRTEEQR